VCGLCGVFSLDGPLAPSVRAALPSMNDALSHRGPDGGGTLASWRAAFGHRRLAIIDVAQGAQPMTNEDQSCWIVFNGEVYNHASLRKDLQARGHVFRTTSDTEAILHAYEEYGAASVNRLEGMFAFAVYDGRRGELFVARDRIGKKPLFYATFDGVFHFASEIKALTRSPLWNGDIDWSGLEGYLSLGYFIAPRTIYRRVQSLEPGHWLRVRNGQIEVRQYWDVESFDNDGRPEPALVDELEAMLGSFVRERLESEVPLGAFLSGGIDSGLVVSFMADALGRDVTTTSVGFGEEGHNELDAAALTAGRYRTRHHPMVVEPQLDQVLDRIVDAFDQPFADSSAIPTYYVSKMARQHVTVALSGDGGDEVFGGYGARYVPHAVEAHARQLLPGLSESSLAAWLGARWPRTRRLPRPLRLGSILENLGNDAATAYYTDLCFMKPAETRRLLGLPGDLPRDNAAFTDVTDAYRRCPSRSAVQRAQYADLKVYLPNDMLVKVDRMSMLNSLEIRCPLLDRRLVEFGFRIPAETKSPWFRSKHLLRRLGTRRLPPALLRLPKHGFTAPVGAWLAGPYAGRFADDVLGPHSAVRALVDVNRVRAVFAEHREGRRDHWYPLWAVWMLARWAEHHRDAAQSRPSPGAHHEARIETTAVQKEGAPSLSYVACGRLA
jgi:asparagine synthase (glutamine-hydrolysing)